MAGRLLVPFMMFAGAASSVDIDKLGNAPVHSSEYLLGCETHRPGVFVYKTHSGWGSPWLTTSVPILAFFFFIYLNTA